MSVGNLHCATSPTLKHAAEPGRTRDHCTAGTCRHCGAKVYRAHKHSSVWWTDAEKDGTPRRLS